MLVDRVAQLIQSGIHQLLHLGLVADVFPHGDLKAIDLIAGAVVGRRHHNGLELAFDTGNRALSPSADPRIFVVFELPSVSLELAL